jgi:C4-dicarboxylate-specific signal transduction histidine kinase
LVIDAKAMVPWDDWPMDVATSPVAVWLEHGNQRLVLQPGSPAAATPSGHGWTYAFHKRLAADSQPFDVVAQRHVGWAELPWPAILGWLVLVWAAVLGGVQVQRQRAGRQRAEALLRLDQVARLNTLGELAAGMAHELNQPLTAVLANTQAARRLLAEDPPELDVARNAMQQAAEQARRAADVLGRLRRSIERPDTPRTAQAIDLGAAIDRALYLLEPESTRRQVAITRDTPPGLAAWADPVALDQIVHNLLMNALQALERVPATERTLRLVTRLQADEVQLQVIDSGPGIAPDDLARLFEPFFSTRDGGLGLGLSLSESLAQGMGGALTANAHPPRGAVFTLTLTTGPQHARDTRAA